jgi:hypothetical protein
MNAAWILSVLTALRPSRGGMASIHALTPRRPRSLATLKLLERLITVPDVRHVQLIGAYRNNDGSWSHPCLEVQPDYLKAA